MKINNNFNLPFSFEKGFEESSKNILKLDSKKQETKNYNINDFLDESEYVSLSENYKNSQVNFKDLPEGISRYEHKGSRYTIFKKGEDYKSEFYAPKGSDRAAFFESYSSLKPEKINLKTDSKNFINNINGKIDEKVLQGGSGDCWLLVALNSLSFTEKGQQIIKDSITVNDDNTVTVSFKGIGYSYTLTQSEIARYDTDNNLNDSYSNGDNDALIFEIATQKLWKDINSGKIKLDTTNEDINDISRSIDNGGYPIQMLYYLTGTESDEYYDLSNDDINNIDTKTIYNILNNAYKNGNYSITFGIYNGEHTGQLTDGSQYSLDVGDGGHALSIKNITADTVTFVNPWDNSIEYTMSYQEFANLGIGYISVCDLSKTNYKEEIVDMTGYNPTEPAKDDDSKNIFIDDKDDVNNNSNDTDYYDYEFDHDFNPNNYNHPNNNHGQLFDISSFINILVTFFINFSALLINNMFEKTGTDTAFGSNKFSERL